MNPHEQKFLLDELFSLTLMATVQRAGVYKRNTSERGRKAFQSALRTQLGKITHCYRAKVSEEVHMQYILGLSTHLSTFYPDVLQGGRFRMGTAQKALNFYLKYLWCLGTIPEPPHCPFDFRIIAKLTAYNGPTWTVLDSEDDYRYLVRLAKEEAQGSSLASWELETYNKI